MMLQLTQNMWVPFQRYLFNSFFISTVGTAVYIVIASLAAFPLAKHKFPGSVLYFQIVVWAILFRPEVTGIPQYIIISKLGMVNTYFAVILPVLAGSFGVFLMRQFMVTIPDDMLEAAKIDGSSEYRTFWTIVMPVVKPAWLTLIIFTFQQLWNSTGVQYIYDENMKVLPVVLQQITTAGIARAGAGSAVALFLMIPPILIFILSQSSVMETMAHSGLKD
jgi:ABC-type glycerol-3-phosphate transport system permease component